MKVGSKRDGLYDSKLLGPELRIIHGDELILIKSRGTEVESMTGHVTKIPDSEFSNAF